MSLRLAGCYRQVSGLARAAALPGDLGSQRGGLCRT